MAAIPSHPRFQTRAFVSGGSSAAALTDGIDRSASSEEAEDGGDIVHVAVGKSVEKTGRLLQWVFRTFQGQEICLLHVHQPSPLIPTLLGKLPARQANPEVLAAFRGEERENTKKLLSNYLMTCSRSKIKASNVTIEADDVRKGIVDLVNLHNIRKLVVGATPDCIKGKKVSRKASYTAKHAPPFCEVWFVDKGKSIWTRKASSLPVCLSATAVSYNTRSRSLPSNENEESQTDLKLASSSSCRESSYDLLDRQNLCSSTSSIYDSGCSPSAEPALSSFSRAKSLEEELRIQLEELKLSVDESKIEANMTHLDLQNLVARTAEAFDKVKALELAHSREIKLRTEAEGILRVTTQEHENLMEAREKLTEQLQKTMRNIAVLDSRANEVGRRHQEVAAELKIIQASIMALRQEKNRLQGQKIEAMRWLDRWRNQVRYEEANESKYSGPIENIYELPMFFLSDLENATCNFSESFMIGQGGYGVVYKGEMLGKTIAVKKLHSFNMQKEAQVHNMVQILGRLRHPHIVELIGVCPESWLLVYEYLPGGNLKNYLCNDNNLCTLNWKTRAQIVADIASGLLFLHSFEPQMIVHGNLKPENILLDSQFRCKISDFGDHMLISSQTLRCPSFRRCASSTVAFSYTDPESRRTGALTYKSDIFSFGLIILQLVTGKSLVGLIGEVCRAVSYGNLASVLDLSAGEWSMYVARRLIELGLQCCELNGRDRPELTPSLVKELGCLPFLEEKTIPSFFLCPILQEIMHDPQVAADGFTYEGEALRGWLKSGHETSPMTNLKLSHLNLTPNHALRLAIQDWLCKS